MVYKPRVANFLVLPEYVLLFLHRLPDILNLQNLWDPWKVLEIDRKLIKIIMYLSVRLVNPFQYVPIQIHHLVVRVRPIFFFLSW